ncbi:MAG: motility associated factor glycosyltransferase family protein [Deltaproteobacteria bacterium]|nr:motility associated factor glycosyltransferase family protein [Deltaproteobacteria bacterium]
MRAPAAVVLATRSGSATVEIDGLAIASRIDPAREAATLVAKVDPTIEWICLAGWGSGHVPRALLARCPRAHVLVLEPSPAVLAVVAAHPELGRSLRDPRVTVSADPFALRFRFEEEYLPGASVATLALPTYQRLFPADVRSYFALIDQSRVRSEANVLSRMMLGGRWLDHLLTNLRAVASSPLLERLRGRFRGVPAICVACGPSLDKNIDVLRDAGDRSLILAAGSALKPLRSRGVEPHLVAAIEWRDAVLEQFEDQRVDDLFLLLSAVSHPNLFRLGARGTFTELPAASPACEWLARVLEAGPEFAEGGSVAHTVFSAALLLGCDPIVLVGQDLALGAARVTHSSLSVHAHIRSSIDEESSIDPVTGRAYELPGYHGGTVATVREFYCYHAWFEDRIQQLAPAPRLINATEGGARIRGTEQLALREVVGSFSPLAEDPREALAAATELPDGRGLDAVRAALIASRRAVLEAGRLGKEAIRLVGDLERAGPGGERTAVIGRKLDRIERQLVPIVETDPFVRSLTAPAMYRFQRAQVAGPPRDPSEAFSWSIELSRMLHRAVHGAANDLVPRLAQALDEL